MNRAHAYKALKENNDDDKGINMGLFSYPILMAADILMFNSTYVCLPRPTPTSRDDKGY